MFRKRIIARIQSLFRYFGLEVATIAKREPPQVFNNLEQVLSLKITGVHAVYECPLNLCVIQNGFALLETGWHPFVAAYKKMLDGSGDIRLRGSFLQKYYNTWDLGSSRDAVAGIDDAPALLESVASYALHVPWMEACPEDRQGFRESISLDENRAAGYPEIPVEDGYGLHGPVSDKKGEVELQRLVRSTRGSSTMAMIEPRATGI